MTAKKDVVLVSDHPMTLGVQFLMDHVMRHPALDAAYRVTGILCSSRDFARIEAPFSPAEEEYLLDYLAETRPAVVGISCIERTRPRFMGSLAKIKAILPDAFYMAGGIDAASDPQFYLSHGIDLVVNGDGEIPLATVLEQLRNGKTPADFVAHPPEGSFTAAVGQARPAPSPERLPLPYYGDRLLSLTARGLVRLREQFARPKHVQFVNRARSIDMYTQRGCTHQCSFCAQDLMVTYRTDPMRNARKRALADVVAHIRNVRESFAGEFVYFWDLDFLRKPKAELLAFAEEYGATVGLPFFIFVTEKTVNVAGVDVIRALAHAGMKTINMGIQSGSERMLKMVYQRNNTPAEARRAVEIIHDATRDVEIEILYDVITYNPQEAADEIRTTIEMVASIPVGGKQHIRLSTHKMSFNTGQTFRNGGAAHTSEDYQDFKSNAAIYERTQSPYLSWLLGQAMRGSITAGRLGSVRRESLPRLLDPAYIKQMDDNRHLGQPLYEAFVPLDSDAFVLA
jgi:hypothetical protein